MTLDVLQHQEDRLRLREENCAASVQPYHHNGITCNSSCRQINTSFRSFCAVSVVVRTVVVNFKQFPQNSFLKLYFARCPCQGAPSRTASSRVKNLNLTLELSLFRQSAKGGHLARLQRTECERREVAPL